MKDKNRRTQQQGKKSRKRSRPNKESGATTMREDKKYLPWEA